MKAILEKFVLRGRRRASDSTTTTIHFFPRASIPIQHVKHKDEANVRCFTFFYKYCTFQLKRDCSWMPVLFWVIGHAVRYEYFVNQPSAKSGRIPGLLCVYHLLWVLFFIHVFSSKNTYAILTCPSLLIISSCIWLCIDNVKNFEHNNLSEPGIYWGLVYEVYSNYIP